MVYAVTPANEVGVVDVGGIEEGTAEDGTGIVRIVVGHRLLRGSGQEDAVKFGDEIGYTRFLKFVKVFFVRAVEC